ncbi:restriction endonuclease subunit S [Cruoricaptor ignavus]|uniref:Restriction endonuclease subunit S n=1 Tax=Cruoricaptor ignavus TaxID=1118202 RepID=A0A7M1T2I3_9FLAO|nr:restriction endonuclease subunit S [Cruoricaptor ignavus]QOR74060.1 restriction endonuclease subunit S [Cruoricaptor ignavus]
MKLKLKEICNIQFGTYLKPSNAGSLRFLQAKNFSDNGGLLDNFDAFVSDDENTRASLLQKGTVLFAGKGSRFFAADYQDEWGDVVPSSLFYVLTVDEDLILPGYLSAVLNLSKNIAYFQQAGAGSNIPSLRKKELADFEIEIPPLEIQEKIVAMKKLHDEEMKLADAIKDQKILLYQTAINNILK